MQAASRVAREIREKAERFVKRGNSDYHQIQVAAYYKAQARGFVADHELDDWLEAEQEFNKRTASGGTD